MVPTTGTGRTIAMEPPATGDCGGAPSEGRASARPEPPSSLLIIEELEVLVHICGFLAQPKDLGRLACTSRAFGRKTSWKCAGMGEGEGAAQWSVVDETLGDNGGSGARDGKRSLGGAKLAGSDALWTSVAHRKSPGPSVVLSEVSWPLRGGIDSALPLGIWC